MDLNLIRQSIRSAASLSFSRSGGPGGQNVNKVNTKVLLRLAVKDLAGLSEAEAARLRETLKSRLSESGELIIASSEERSQRVNLERAYARAEALIGASAGLPKRRRIAKVSKAAREQRLRSKRLQGEKKAGRKPLAPDY